MLALMIILLVLACLGAPEWRTPSPPRPEMADGAIEDPRAHGPALITGRED